MIEARVLETLELLVVAVEVGGALRLGELEALFILLGETFDLLEQEDDTVHPRELREQEVEQAVEVAGLHLGHDDADLHDLAGLAVLFEVAQAEHGLLVAARGAGDALVRRRGGAEHGHGDLEGMLADAAGATREVLVSEHAPVAEQADEVLRELGADQRQNFKKVGVVGRLAAGQVEVVAFLVELDEGPQAGFIVGDLLLDLVEGVLIGRMPKTLHGVRAEHAGDIALRPDREVRHEPGA